MAIPEKLLVSNRLQQVVDQMKQQQSKDSDSSHRPALDPSHHERDASGHERPLHGVAQAIVLAADCHGQTTIVAPGHDTQLRPTLLSSLSQSLRELSGRTICWEVAAPQQMGWPNLYHLRKHQAMMKRLRKAMPQDVEVSSCFCFSRPAGQTRPLRIGLLDDARSIASMLDKPYFRVVLLDAGPSPWKNEQHPSQVIRYRLLRQAS